MCICACGFHLPVSFSIHLVVVGIATSYPSYPSARFTGRSGGAARATTTQI